MDTTAERKPEKEYKSQAKSGQLIVFKIGMEEYGLDISLIKEVVLTPHLTKVPLAPTYIRGVANIRGNIIAIVDLERRLGLEQHSSDDAALLHYTLVVEHEDVKMGILVKEVPNTLAITEDQIELSPTIIQDQMGSSKFVKGLVKQKDRLIILLDLLQLISKEDIKSVE